MADLNKKGRKRANAPLVIAMALTLALGFLVIRGVSTEVSQRKPNPKFDVQKVRNLIQKGRISDHEAEYWEVVP